MQAQLDSLEVRIPDCVETVYGWRSWLAGGDSDDVLLRSPLYGTPWALGRETVARCSRPALPAHLAPSDRCNCGIYASTSAAAAARSLHLARAHDIAPNAQPVIGRVALWGKVVECDDGWRAERAYPARIYVPLAPATAAHGGRARAMRRAARLAQALRAYRVPVHLVTGDPAELDLLDAVATNAEGRRHGDR